MFGMFNVVGVDKLEEVVVMMSVDIFVYIFLVVIDGFC